MTRARRTSAVTPRRFGPLSDSDRSRIGELDALGCSLRRIAGEVGCSPETARQWLYRFALGVCAPVQRDEQAFSIAAYFRAGKRTGKRNGWQCAAAATMDTRSDAQRRKGMEWTPRIGSPCRQLIRSNARSQDGTATKHGSEDRMLGRLGSMFQQNGDSAPHSPAVVGSPDGASTAPGSHAGSRPEWHYADEQAAALLAWLQGPDGLTGEITASEVMSCWREMLLTNNWEDIGWTKVAKELRRLLGDTRQHFGSRKSRRTVVYHIPRLGQNVVPFAAPAKKTGGAG
jgi:hypothetical protein